MGEELRVCTWNMRHNPAAWERLARLGDEHAVQVALVQEAVPPPNPAAWRTHPGPAETLAWRVRAHNNVTRNFASAVIVLDDDLDMEVIDAAPLGEAEYRRFAVSHPGQFAVAAITTPLGGRLTVVSLYGVWDGDARYIYAEATLHRAISDLTILFQDPNHSPLLLAGDLNVYRDWARAERGAAWAPRYDTVFDRLRAYGLDLRGPFGLEPLPGCPCRRDECDHARTYAHRADPSGTPYQLDYVFTTEPAGEVAVIDEHDIWQYSDHLPVLATVPVG